MDELDGLGLPERPRLASAVHARLHVVDGETKVMLTDTRNGLVAEIDDDSWTVVTLADGTRDLDALALACAREGVYRSESELRALIEELDDAGLLADGLEVPGPPPPVPRPGAPESRPLAPLEGFTLVCDGKGSCCRFYGSVGFMPNEAMRATLWAEGLDVAVPEARLFTPVRGAQLDPDVPRAVALVDGCCAFLEADGRCGLHRLGGASAKPFPCRFYPATLVDDGVSVRVSAAPECACVLASDGRTDGTPLVPSEARTLADLGPSMPVMVLSDPVPLTGSRPAPLDAYRRWSARLTDGLRGSSVDAVDLVLALADSVEARGLDVDALDALLAAPPRADPSVLDPWIDALASRASEVAASLDRWRSASDLSRRVARWIAAALAGADRAAWLDAPDDPAAERFYLRALAHGHRLAIEGRPLVDGLRDRATRLVAARAMTRVEAPTDTAGPYPLALVEAAMRNLGLRVDPSTHG